MTSKMWHTKSRDGVKTSRFIIDDFAVIVVRSKSDRSMLIQCRREKVMDIETALTSLGISYEFYTVTETGAVWWNISGITDAELLPFVLLYKSDLHIIKEHILYGERSRLKKLLYKPQG